MCARARVCARVSSLSLSHFCRRFAGLSLPERGQVSPRPSNLAPRKPPPPPLFARSSQSRSPETERKRSPSPSPSPPPPQPHWSMYCATCLPSAPPPCWLLLFYVENFWTGPSTVFVTSFSSFSSLQITYELEWKGPEEAEETDGFPSWLNEHLSHWEPLTWRIKTNIGIRNRYLLSLDICWLRALLLGILRLQVRSPPPPPVSR